VVRFLTLFVGLVVGQQNVELAVTGAVSRIELRLNGTVLAATSQEPWTVRCDFGNRPRPGRLEVIGLDSRGLEVGRDVQWINLASQRADAAILPEVDDSGALVGARLTWSSPEFRKPKKVSAMVDGDEVEIKRAEFIDLGRVPRDGLHLLTVEILFPDGVSVRRELAFGMGFSGDHSLGLTALPVVLGSIDELPGPAQMEAWFVHHGQPVEAAAVERGIAQLVVVVDPAVRSQIEELFQERKRSGRRRRERDNGPRLADALGEDVEVRVLIPEPVVAAHTSQPALLFPFSKQALAGSDGVLKAVVASRPGQVMGAGLMLGDGVAMAAIRAAENNRRRAVLVMLGPAREDISRVSPGASRSFARDLHVPLVVWDLTGDRSSPPDGWDPDRQIRNVDELRRACRRLQHALDEQRIVWLVGRYLPQELELASAGASVTIAR
jgi:hypothetical protein